ncbi:MAG: acyltransferase family protein [Pseudomonadales bacterium]
MLGIFRYILALAVTLSHLWTSFAGWSAVAAVFGFYVISGYLMTSILNQSYGYTRRGIARYALNRALRIFPTYWFVMLLSIVVVAMIPREAFLTNFKLSMPSELGDWAANIFILGLLDGPLKVLVPPAWTLDIELVFYIAMGVGLSRSKSTVTIWFAASLAYTLFLLLTGAEFPQRYASYAAASLPFSIGAMTYMYRHEARRLLRLPLAVAVVLLLAAAVASRLEWLAPLGGGFYIMLVCNTLLLIALNNIDVKKISPRLQVCDRMLGNIAYPLFLCHWQVAAVVLAVFYAGEKPDGGQLWLTSFIFIHMVALLVYYLVDRNVDKARTLVRGKERIDLASLAKS